MNRPRRTLSMLTLTVLMLVLAFGGTAIAEDGDEFGTMTTLISDYSCGVGEAGANKVGSDGHTATFDYVYYIEVSLTLQRWNGSSWVSVTSRTFERYDDNYVFGVFTHDISQSGWYRTRGDHYAQHGWTTDEATCFSPNVWVAVN